MTAADRLQVGARALIGARLDGIGPEARRAEVRRLMEAHGKRPVLSRNAWRLRLLGLEADCKTSADGAIDGWAWLVILEARRARRAAA